MAWLSGNVGDFKLALSGVHILNKVHQIGFVRYQDGYLNKALESQCKKSNNDN